MPRLSREQLLHAIGMLEAGQGQCTVARYLGCSQPAISNMSRQYNQTHYVNDRPQTELGDQESQHLPKIDRSFWIIFVMSIVN
ncbi:UNVERIFIED_CONTAM: hypothetical protein FKN15_009519 [Acipenser sinensis]